MASCVVSESVCGDTNESQCDSESDVDGGGGAVPGLHVSSVHDGTSEWVYCRIDRVVETAATRRALQVLLLAFRTPVTFVCAGDLPAPTDGSASVWEYAACADGDVVTAVLARSQPLHLFTHASRPAASAQAQERAVRSLLAAMRACATDLARDAVSAAVMAANLAVSARQQGRDQLEPRLGR